MMDVVSQTRLDLPIREEKPRRSGVTMVIDKGLPLRYFGDFIETYGDVIDFVKFGWGTSIVASELPAKLKVLRREGVDFYFGGTLFEKFVLQDRFEGFRAHCEQFGCKYVEVSNGTIDMSDAEKCRYVAELSRDFTVISEVGSKDQMKSENMAPSKWIRYINDDLDAGARFVTLEARESGHSGICRPNGELRFGLIEEIFTSGIDVDRLMFEAPSADLQSYFVSRVGTNVNLGNIAASDVLSLETVRLGLRSETLHTFETATIPNMHEGE
jgi:phosphosulfolactate synthase